MKIDEKKLIEDLKAWQVQIRANGDIYAIAIDAMIDVVIALEPINGRNIIRKRPVPARPLIQG